MHVSYPSMCTCHSGDDDSSVRRVFETKAVKLTPLSRQLAWMFRVTVKISKYLIVKINEKESALSYSEGA